MAVARVLAVARRHRTHQGVADELGVSLRTVVRWWTWLRAHPPADPLPPRDALAALTPEARALGGSR